MAQLAYLNQDHIEKLFQHLTLSAGLVALCKRPQELMNYGKVRYQMVEADDTILLKIWEPAAVDDNRLKPYFFMVNYSVQSMGEAKAILKQYMLHNYSEEPLNTGAEESSSLINRLKQTLLPI